MKTSISVGLLEVESMFVFALHVTLQTDEPALARSRAEAQSLLNDPSSPDSISVIEANFTLPGSQLRTDLEVFAAGGCLPDEPMRYVGACLCACFKPVVRL